MTSELITPKSLSRQIFLLTASPSGAKLPTLAGRHGAMQDLSGALLQQAKNIQQIPVPETPSKPARKVHKRPKNWFD